MKELNEEQLDIIEDTNTGELPDDKAEFLKSLENEEALENADPEKAKAEEAEQAQQVAVDAKAAKMTATMGLDVIEFSLKRFIHPEFEFTSATKEKAIENFGPVLIKYGTLVPAWAAEYEPEINAAIAVGSLVSEGIDTAKTLKAKDAAIAEAKQRQKDQQDGRDGQDGAQVAA